MSQSSIDSSFSNDRLLIHEWMIFDPHGLMVDLREGGGVNGLVIIWENDGWMNAWIDDLR